MKKNASERELVDRLKGVPLFANTSAKQRKALAQMGKVQTWKEGTVGVTEGTKGAAFFLLLSGGVEVTRGGNAIAQLGAGDFVGEVALLSNNLRNATVTAKSETSVFTLGRPALAAALKTDPAMSMTLLAAMAERQQGVQ